MLIICVVIGILLPPTGSQTGDCNEFAFERLLHTKQRTEYHGRYVNRTYEYSVVIPAQYTAYDVPDPANHQGFGLVLSKMPQTYIFVRGEPNSLEYQTLREAIGQITEWLRQKGRKAVSQMVTDSHLGPLDAVLVETSYTCSGSPQTYSLTSVLALSTNRRFLYTVELYSKANQYKHYRAVLNRIRRSWIRLNHSR